MLHSIIQNKDVDELVRGPTSREGVHGMPVEENPAILGRWWEKVQSTKEARRYIRIVLLLGLVVLLTAVVGCAGGGENQADSAAPDTATTAEQTAERTQQPPGGTTAGDESTPAGAETTGARAETGTITGRVTDEDTGEPLSDVYLAVGWRGIQLTAITDADGRYTVPNVPAGESAPVFGFHDDGYRYRASSFDDNLSINLEPGETYTYDFSLVELNEPENEPRLSDPSLAPDTAASGETVTFELTARNGAGGLSPEIFAANPDIGRLVLLKPTDEQDRYRAEFTIPADTPPGDYPFVFFAASNKCYVNGEFPMLTVTVTE